MHLRILATTLAALISCPLSADEKNDLKKSAEDAARQMLDAMMKGDCEKMVDQLRPEVHEMAGNRETLIRLLKKQLSDAKERGFTFESYKLAETSDPVQLNKGNYLTIKYTLIINGPDGKVRFHCFLLGTTTDSGKVWKFIEGDGMDAEKFLTMRIAMPDLPKDMVLPKRKAPEQIKD